MEYNKLNLIYFSATATTKEVMLQIAKGTDIQKIKDYDITSGQTDEIWLEADDIALFGVPVYSGRVPQIAINSINKFKGNHTPAIIVCVYGNRNFDDALVELKDLVSANGFKVISAGAFVAQHSIFPQVGKNRPDKEDKIIAFGFGETSMEKLSSEDSPSDLPELMVEGNTPYRKYIKVPLTPKVNKNCNICGKCARQCPTHAIDISTPSNTDKNHCIACGRCIYVCPENARSFGGILYWFAQRKFLKKYSIRKEPYIAY